MATHVKILAVIHIGFGAICILAGLAVLLFFGGLASFIGLVDQQHDTWIAIPILGGIGVVVVVFAAALALPGIIAGIGLLRFRNWARILMIVLSALHLLNVPIGTLLGLYGFWVLLSAEGQRLFEHQPQVAKA